MKQIDLSGNPIEPEHQEDTDNIYVLMSALQKAIRRTQAEKAMLYAINLCEINYWKCWQRLQVIAVEDVGQSAEIVAVDTLYRQFIGMKKAEKEITWNMKRLCACAAKILAESYKDRRADEILEMIEASNKGNQKAKEYLEELAKIQDVVYDEHTREGKKMGRGLKFWLEESSKVFNAHPNYGLWREKFEELMKKDE